MAQIFISYAREDFKQVSELRQRLKDEGFTPWMDKVDLLAGQRWRPAIEQAVHKSDFFVLCLSNRTVSKRSFVQREIKMALDLWQEMLADDIFLIPVLLEHIEPEEIPVSLREIGWVFLYEEDGWNDLMRALKHGMKQRAIAERDERKKEEDTFRQNAAEAARLEREAAEQRLREETARLKKEKDEIERKLYEETARRQQEETALLKKEREAAELQRQAEATQQQKERADRQQHEVREQEQTKQQHRTKEATLPIIDASPITTLPKLISKYWPMAVGLTLSGVFTAIVFWGVWKQAPPSENNAAQIQVNLPTFEFETVRLDRNGKEVERRKLQARYFTEDLANNVKLDMVEIPGGTFTMGSPASEARRESDEGPQHSVNISSFWMGKFEITQAQWQALMGNNPSNFKGDGNLPVEQVSWNDTQEFLKKLNALPNLKGKNYRLPTEAEWEYAARAGTTTPFAFGETITPQIVNYNGNHPYANAAKGLYRRKTVPVGSLGVANAFGLFDMHGNVWEWCQDVWQNSYNGAPSDGSARLSGGDSSSRVLRGGSWNLYGNYVRSANRSRDSPGYIYADLGFRVVCART